MIWWESSESLQKGTGVGIARISKKVALKGKGKSSGSSPYSGKRGKQEHLETVKG